MVSSQLLEVPQQLSLTEFGWLVQPVFVIRPHSPESLAQEKTSNMTDSGLTLKLLDAA